VAILYRTVVLCVGCYVLLRLAVVIHGLLFAPRKPATTPSLLVQSSDVSTPTPLLAKEVEAGDKVYTQDAYRATQHEARDLTPFPPPFPNGWYKLAASADVKPGDVLPLKCLGLNLV
jgi:hypothetical protein